LICIVIENKLINLDRFVTETINLLVFDKGQIKTGGKILIEG